MKWYPLAPFNRLPEVLAEFSQALRDLAHSHDLSQFKPSPIDSEAERRLKAAIAQRRAIPESVSGFKPISQADVEYEARRLRGRRALVVWRPQA